MEKKEGLNVGVKSFISAILVIFGLMVVSYILTFLIPGGTYARRPDGTIDTAAGFTATQGGLPFWKWALSPVLVMGASGGGTLIAVIAFLLVIGGVFGCLEKCGLMQYMLHKTTHRFAGVRYQLMAVLTLLFMAMGAMIGSFEECVPMVPIVVALSISLGWDAITGLSISLLAVGCGFAAGICNPFTVGVAQQLAGLPMFSGVWLRLVAFILIYGLLMLFITLRAKKIEKPPVEQKGFTADSKMDRGLKWFLIILGAGIAAVLSSGFIKALQDYTMIIVAVTFLAAGLCSCTICGMEHKFKTFISGLTAILPAVLMILMASSIRYTLEEAQVLDSLLHSAVGVAETLPKWSVILFIYLLVLVMNFFIPSGSAKAFMLIPLIVPMAGVFGISAQLCVVAFAFGDGFSNVFYPTNPALLIALGLADVSYPTWFKKSCSFQFANLILTSLLLLLGLAAGY